MGSYLLQPTYRQTHPADHVLSNMSIGFEPDPESFFARKFFPVVPVDEKTGFYPVADRGDLLRVEVKPRAMGTKPARAGFGVGTGEYRCIEKALAKGVPWEMRSGKSIIDIDKASISYLNTQINLEQDLQFAQTFLQDNVWTTTWTGNGTAGGGWSNAGQYDTAGKEFLKWSVATADPIEHLTMIIESQALATGKKPNKIGIGPNVWAKLKNHPLVRNRVPATSAQYVTRDLLRQLLEVDDFVIFNSIYNTAAEGLAPSFAYVAPNAVLVAYVTPTPALWSPTAGYIFSWADPVNKIAGLAESGNALIRQWVEEEEKQDVYCGEAYYGMGVTAPDAAVLMLDVVA